MRVWKHKLQGVSSSLASIFKFVQASSKCRLSAVCFVSDLSHATALQSLSFTLGRSLVGRSVHSFYLGFSLSALVLLCYLTPSQFGTFYLSWLGVHDCAAMLWVSKATCCPGPHLPLIIVERKSRTLTHWPASLTSSLLVNKRSSISQKMGADAILNERYSTKMPLSSLLTSWYAPPLIE